MTRIKQLEKTCDSCPSQWEGILEDGRYLYVRYRWGFLRVSAGKTLAGAIGDEETLFEKQIGGTFDGLLDEADMLKVTGMELC